MFRWPRRKTDDKPKPLTAPPPATSPAPHRKEQYPTTDDAWEAWGRRDPYFGVITHARFRRAQMSAEDRQDFFDSGRMHVEYVMQTIHRFVNPWFAPGTVLDFGCGVGRTVIPFAPLAKHVTGVDVSSAMLAEATRNCEERQLRNVSLLATDDSLSALQGTFDLIHSYIVFQHIPLERGRAILRNLLAHLTPGGIGALQFCYGSRRAAVAAAARADALMTSAASAASAVEPLPQVTVLDSDPEMQMNVYPMNEVLALLQEFNIQRLHAEFSDHGGELGIFLFFATEAIPPDAQPHAAGTAQPA